MLNRFPVGYKCLVAFSFLLKVSLSICFAQFETSKNADFNAIRTSITPSPEMALYQRYGEVPVDYSSGVANISIPIADIKLRDFNWPISLSYHGGGNKVNDFASVVGLGWVLNGSGYITSSNTDGTGWGAEIKRTYNLAKKYDPYYSNCDEIYQNELDVIAAGIELQQKSLFRPIINYLSMPQANLKFIFRDSSYVTAPISNYKIITNVNGTIVIDPNGNRFYFNDYGGKTTFTSCKTTSYTDNSSVGLSKIITYRGDSIIFSYDKVSYTYNDPNHETKQRVSSLDCQRCQQDVIPDNKNCPVYNQVTELILKSIVSSNGQKVSFHYGARTDHPGGKKLESILVQELSDGLYINKAWYTLGQSYFGDSASDNLRLKLDNFKNIINSTNQEVYNFDYYTAAVLPNRLSKQVDLAGFYNAASANTTLIPSLSDRNSLLYYTMAGVLTKITYPTGGSSKFDYELGTWGGLRIKEITDYTANNSPAKKKTYDYGSTGVHINNDFVNVDNQYFFGHGLNGLVDNTLPLSTMNLITCTVFTEQTTPVSSFLSAWMDAAKYYSEVVEYTLDYSTNVIGENGKVVYKYNSSGHFDLKGRQASLISLGAKLTEKEVYRNDNELLSKEEYFYSVAEDHFPIIDFWGEPLNPRDSRFWIKRLELLRDEMSHQLSADLQISGSRCYGKEFLQQDYWLDIPVLYLDKQVFRTFSSGQEIKDEKLYSYDKVRGEIEPNQITRTSSNGSTISELIKYNISDLTVLNYNAAEMNANIKLANQNIIVPLWKKISKGSTEVESSQVYYQNFGGNAYPSKEVISFSGQPAKEVKVIKYDLKGNINELSNQDLKLNAYRYSSRGEMTAEFINAPFDETAYASFDNGGETGLSYSPSAVWADEAYSGKFSYRLGLGTITKPGLVVGKNYIITAVIKSGSISITGGTVNSSVFTTLVNGWVLQQIYFTATSTMIGLSGSGSIDDINIYPKEATATTMVYTDFYGQLASRTDSKGLTTFFDYQPDGKLWCVKDFAGNILKQYCYNLAGQSVDCNTKPTIAPPSYYAVISVSNILTEYPNGPFNPDYTTYADIKIELFTDADATTPYYPTTDKIITFQETLTSDLGYGQMTNNYLMNRTVAAGSSSVSIGRYAIDRVYEEVDPYNPWATTLCSANLSYQVVSQTNNYYIPLTTFIHF